MTLSPTTSPSKIDVQGLIERLNRGECSNELDIAIELAMFDPPVSVRANDAGTKLIYTLRSGKQETCLAGDHSLTPMRRNRSEALLKALQAQGETE